MLLRLPIAVADVSTDSVANLAKTGVVLGDNP